MLPRPDPAFVVAETGFRVFLCVVSSKVKTSKTPKNAPGGVFKAWFSSFSSCTVAKHLNQVFHAQNVFYSTSKKTAIFHPLKPPAGPDWCWLCGEGIVIAGPYPRHYDRRNPPTALATQIFRARTVTRISTFIDHPVSALCIFLEI